MTEGETFVLVKLLPGSDVFVDVVDGHVYLRADDRRPDVNQDQDPQALIGHTLELEADIEFETAAEPGDAANTGRWRNRFLGPWRTGSKPWEEVKNRD